MKGLWLSKQYFASANNTLPQQKTTCDIQGPWNFSTSIYFNTSKIKHPQNINTVFGLSFKSTLNYTWVFGYHFSNFFCYHKHKLSWHKKNKKHVVLWHTCSASKKNVLHKLLSKFAKGASSICFKINTNSRKHAKKSAANFQQTEFVAKKILQYPQSKNVSFMYFEICQVSFLNSP